MHAAREDLGFSSCGDAPSQHLEPDLQRLAESPQCLLLLALALVNKPQVIVRLCDVGMLRPQHLELDLQHLVASPRRRLLLALALVN